MPQRVTWNLQYLTRTEDQHNQMRHHFETFRLDAHVDSVELHESAEVPYLSIMTVAFTEDHDQPVTRELQYMDRRYPVQTTARVEHQIQVSDATGSRPADPVRALTAFGETMRAAFRFVPPRVMTTTAQQRAIQDAARQLMEGPLEFVPMEPPHPEIPEWLKLDRDYIDSTQHVVTVKRLRDVDAVPTVGFVTKGDHEPAKTRWMILAEFLNTFEPYVPPVAPSHVAKTAWERVLEIDED